jgi:hypothetical protein
MFGDWKTVDRYLKEDYCNIDDYRNIFAFLFKFHYECGLIDKTQFQIALQIQQVRTHPLLYKKYEFYRKKYDETLLKLPVFSNKKEDLINMMVSNGMTATRAEAEEELEFIDLITPEIFYDSVELIYFEELEQENQERLLDTLMKRWSPNCAYKYPIDWKTTCRTSIKKKLKRSIWYKSMLCNCKFYVYPKSKHFPISSSLFFPIPETLNFSSFLYTYEPQVVAGSLKSSTYIKHIFDHKKRPFILWHPDIKSGFPLHAQQTDVFIPIASHWIHDFIHMSVLFSKRNEIKQADRERVVRRIIREKQEDNAHFLHDSGALLHPQSQWKHHSTRQSIP